MVGIAHPKWEERPLALVVIRDSEKSRVTPDDIRTHLAKTFAKWQLPDEVLLVDQIPKTSVGKMNKKEIREQYKAIYGI